MSFNRGSWLLKGHSVDDDRSCRCSALGRLANAQQFHRHADDGWIFVRCKRVIAESRRKCGVEASTATTQKVNLDRALFDPASVFKEPNTVVEHKGLPQPDATPVGEPHQNLAGAVEKPRIGREHHILGLYRGVDNDAIEVRWSDRFGLGGNREALLEQGLQPLFPHALAPAGQRRAIEHQPVPEEFLAAEVLVIGVLYPALAQRFVGQVVGVLENRIWS